MVTTVDCRSASVLGGGHVISRTHKVRTGRPCVRPQALFGFGGRDEEKEREKKEQMRVQQEVLKRRKANSWQAEVKDRRAKASRCVSLGRGGWTDGCCLDAGKHRPHSPRVILRSLLRLADGLTCSLWTHSATDT
jgi:hypothetical protein